MRLRTLGFTLVPVTLLVALGECSATAGELTAAVDDRPGVVSVAAQEEDGDDDLPFTHIPLNIEVVMTADASADEVMAVFDAYDDAIEDGDLISVDVALEGQDSSLATGEGIQATRAMVDQLVAARADDEVLEFRRQAYPVLPEVALTIEPASFAHVREVADRYHADDVAYLTVTAGNFTVSRDSVNEDLRVTTAREELVERLAAEVPLRLAYVGGRGPLQLAVAPEDEVAARRFLAHTPRSRFVRKVVLEVQRAPKGP